MKRKAVRFATLLSLMGVMFVVRILLEMEDLDTVTFLHQFFWFSFVALWFAAAFRIIGKVSLDKIIWAVPGAVVIFLPLLYAYFTGVALQMNYYSIETLSSTLFDLVTLLYFHSYNSPMFFEMVLLLFGSFFFVYYITKRIFRSMVTALVAFYGSFLIAGVSWFSVSAGDQTLFYLPLTFLSPQTIYMFEFLFLSLLMILTIFLFELKSRKEETPHF